MTADRTAADSAQITGGSVTDRSSRRLLRHMNQAGAADLLETTRTAQLLFDLASADLALHRLGMKLDGKAPDAHAALRSGSSVQRVDPHIGQRPGSIRDATPYLQTAQYRSPMRLGTALVFFSFSFMPRT